jgi:hypothetical protein
MVLARCEKCGRPIGRMREYIKQVEPLNYPSTAVICGRAGCNEPGKIWLEAHEWRLYGKGIRIFSVPSASVKIKVR